MPMAFGNANQFGEPRPSVDRIATLARRVLEGDILLPKFQREFVWNRRQVLDLLDSVARNYPVGSLLLWQSTQELASERNIAGLPVRPRRPGYPVNYLLDGQQRLSTICGALYWRPNGTDADSLWNIAYDLEVETFLHLTKLEDPPPHQIPLRLLADPASYFRRSTTLDSEELRERADLLFNRFQDYMVAVVTLGDMSIEAIAPVFERINSRGTRLTIVELMRAATWRPDFDLQDSIDAVRDVLNDKRYGDIDPKVLLRTISAVAGFGFSRDNIEQLRSLSKDELALVVKQTEQAARHAVDFLTTEIKTPTAAALPYDSQFAVLAAIFSQLPKPTSAQYAAIIRWFWRTILDGRFRNWSTTQMAADRDALRAFAVGTTDDIDIPVALPRSDMWRRNPFRVDNAVTKLLGLLLAEAQPLDLRSGLRIDTGKALSWANDKEYHHFFPKGFLTKRKGLPAERANVPANIIMLTSVTNIWVSDQAPSAYLREISDFDGEEALRERLASCLVSDEAFDAAMRDDYEGFLEARSATLHDRALELAGEIG